MSIAYTHERTIEDTELSTLLNPYSIEFARIRDSTLQMNIREIGTNLCALTTFNLHGEDLYRRFMKEFNIADYNPDRLHGKDVTVYVNKKSNSHPIAIQPRLSKP